MSDVRVWTDSNVPSKTLLFLAAHKGFTQLLAWLINREVWDSVHLKEAFFRACQRGHAEIAKLFFDTLPKIFDLSFR